MSTAKYGEQNNKSKTTRVELHERRVKTMANDYFIVLQRLHTGETAQDGIGKRKG